jgi:hypothetical protein
MHNRMTPDDWQEVLGQAASLGCRAMQFIGDEPTMYPALGLLIERARALGFDRVEVFTNGTMLNPRLKEILLRHHVELAFSVYASTSRTHELVTQQVGSFERTLAAMQWALTSGLSVRAAIIELDANAGQSEQTREMLRAMGVKTIGIDRVRGVGRGAKDLSPASQLNELCGACWRGKLAVTATGQIFPCVFSRFWPVGHVNQGLRAVVEGLALRTFRQEMWTRQNAAGSQGGKSPAEPAKLVEESQPETCPPIEDCQPLEPCTPLTCGPAGPPGCMPDLTCGPEQPPCQPACLPRLPCQPH